MQARVGAPVVTPAQRRLESLLGHSFADTNLFIRALTHRSSGPDDNERLEFLGDALLEFIVAEHLFDECPDAQEGRLTLLRSRVVRRESLAAAARRLGVGDALILGSGERSSGGRDRDSILANAFEALVAAIFIDSDFAACRRCVRAILGDSIESASLDDGRKDAKTCLQELMQSQGRPLPEYRVVDVAGAAHRRMFTVSCRVERLADDAIGTGSSRRRAEQEAAARVLDSLETLDG